ncbi:MAG: hypothetical protein HC933_00835 [Pleurocapsa sp. SU_196_0]|nr:hypothetical protein [Pleurocapsa sp. SU_196_0]
MGSRQLLRPSLGRGGRLQVRAEKVGVKGGGLKESERDVPGKDGVTRTFLGYRDAEATLLLVAQDEAEFETLEAFFRLYRTKQGGPVRVIEVSHPQLAVHGINQVYIFDLNSSDFDPEYGWPLEVTIREWQPTERRQTRGSSETKGGRDANTPGGNTQRPGQPPSTNQRAQANKPSSAKQSSFVAGFRAGSTTAANLVGGR